MMFEVLQVVLGRKGLEGAPTHNCVTVVESGAIEGGFGAVNGGETKNKVQLGVG